MAVDLNTYIVEACSKYKGDDVFDLAAGKTLKIETSPNGEELLSRTVPEGKTWHVTVFVEICEKDAT